MKTIVLAPFWSRNKSLLYWTKKNTVDYQSTTVWLYDWSVPQPRDLLALGTWSSFSITDEDTIDLDSPAVVAPASCFGACGQVEGNVLYLC